MQCPYRVQALRALLKQYVLSYRDAYKMRLSDIAEERSSTVEALERRSFEDEMRIGVLVPTTIGPSLADLLEDRGPCTEDVARNLVYQMTKAIAHVHACGLIHNAIAPENFIVAEDGLKLVDFSLSLVVSPNNTANTANTTDPVKPIKPVKIPASPEAHAPPAPQPPPCVAPAAAAFASPRARTACASPSAAAVAFLASDEASWITGQTIGVNGGSVTS